MCDCSVLVLITVLITNPLSPCDLRAGCILSAVASTVFEHVSETSLPHSDQVVLLALVLVLVFFSVFPLDQSSLPHLDLSSPPSNFLLLMSLFTICLSAENILFGIHSSALLPSTLSGRLRKT